MICVSCPKKYTPLKKKEEGKKTPKRKHTDKQQTHSPSMLQPYHSLPPPQTHTPAHAQFLSLERLCEVGLNFLA